jgi:hypothetical protein
VIDAWQFIPGMPPQLDRPQWINLEWLAETIETDSEGRRWRGESILVIPTLEGTMIAKSHDWIIRGVQGEVYPCKPDIFEATYEAVPDAISATPQHQHETNSSAAAPEG